MDAIPSSAGAETRRLPGPIELLREAWGIYIRIFKTLVGLLVISFLLNAGVIIAGILLFSILIVILTALHNALAIPIVVIIGIFIGIAIFLTFSFWMQGATYYAIEFSEENIGIKESLRRAWPKILSLAWIGILNAFVVWGGFVLFFIPGIILSFSLGFAIWILLSEELRGMDALARSRDYVRGRWGKVAGRLLFIVLLYVPFYILVQLKSLPLIILSEVAIIILSPLIAAYSFILYKHLRELGPVAPPGKTKMHFVLLAILGALIVPLFVVLIIIPITRIAPQLNNAKNNFSMQNLNQNYQNCGLPPPRTPSIHESDTGKEIKFTTNVYGSSTLNIISSQTECVSVAEAAKRLSMPLYFPSYLPSGLAPDTKSHAQIDLNGSASPRIESLTYSFATYKNPKHYLTLILSNTPTLDAKFCIGKEVMGNDRSSVCYGDGIIRKVAADGQYISIYSGTESADELSKIFDSLQPLPTK